MPVIIDEWGMKRRVCESCNAEATWCTDRNPAYAQYFCDLHKVSRGSWYSFYKLEPVTTMLKGEGYLVVPINLSIQEVDDYDEAMAIAGAVAQSTGGALILAVVEKVRPNYNVTGHKTPLGQALAKALENKKRSAALPSASDFQADPTKEVEHREPPPVEG